MAPYDHWHLFPQFIMNSFKMQGLNIARLASRRIATNNAAAQSRNMATRKDGFVPWLMTEITQDHCWPFVGKLIRGFSHFLCLPSLLVICMCTVVRPGPFFYGWSCLEKILLWTLPDKNVTCSLRHLHWMASLLCHS